MFRKNQLQHPNPFTASCQKNIFITLKPSSLFFRRLHVYDGISKLRQITISLVCLLKILSTFQITHCHMGAQSGLLFSRWRLQSNSSTWFTNPDCNIFFVRCCTFNNKRSRSNLTPIFFRGYGNGFRCCSSNDLLISVTVLPCVRIISMARAIR